ncbi:MAG: immunoglobulin-like domain-containing protein, partial [Vicinamibacteria bacterium]
PKVVERDEGGAWTELPETRPEACTLELYILAAGETVVQTIEIPATLGAGTYRIVFDGISFEQGDPAIPPEERTSDSFEIG